MHHTIIASTNIVNKTNHNKKTTSVYSPGKYNLTEFYISTLISLIHPNLYFVMCVVTVSVCLLACLSAHLCLCLSVHLSFSPSLSLSYPLLYLCLSASPCLFHTVWVTLLPAKQFTGGHGQMNEDSGGQGMLQQFILHVQHLPQTSSSYHAVTFKEA